MLITTAEENAPTEYTIKMESGLPARGAIKQFKILYNQNFKGGAIKI